MRRTPALFCNALVLISFFLCGCASSRVEEDGRLEVNAAMATRSRVATTEVLYAVRIRNVSERALWIRRVEVESVGGGRTRPAYETPRRSIEPGEELDLEIWAELESDETIMGVGDALARIIVSFDDGEERALGSYLVELR